MFRKVPNIKLLACGGDGTVGWLLSVLDKIEVDSTATVGVLPLGTGNDLSRSLGWGGGYIDEPISKILNGLQTATEVKMDRWILKVERNADYPSTDKGEDKLPLNVVNNYFSLGVDAQIALQFHEAREANPSKFNSRIRNKMFYGQAGGKDLLLRKWKDLSHEIEVECDGKDITPKLREHRVHSVLFANIPSFGSGTRPWNRGNGEQRIDDGLIEVMGLTTYQLPLLQAGGHATCITQCKTATIKTRKTIPMQVDGEASRLNPATITLSYLNQVSMLAKIKGDSKKDYESFHYDKDRLKELAQSFGEISTTTNADLEAVRNLINKVMENNKPVSSDWCFIDSVTAIRFFRIDRAQENLHYVTDICDEELHILEMDSPSLNDDEKHIMETAIKPATPPPSQSENEAHHHNNSNDHHLSPAENSSSSSNKVPSPSKSLSPSRVVVSSVAEAMDIELAPPIPTAIPTPLPPPMLEKTTEGVLKAARWEIIKFLISKAPPSILDMVDNEKGQTALHKAAGYKRRTICCMLVAAGSSLSIHDQAGLTPRQLAVMAEDHDLSSYLESQEHFQNEQDIDLETPMPEKDPNTTIKQYLRNQNLLDLLVADGEAIEKINGKQKVYAINQEHMATANEAELSRLDQELAQNQEAIKKINIQLKSKEASLKNIESSITTSEAFDRIEQLKEVLVTKAEKETVMKEHEKAVKEWRKRKRMVLNITEAVLESYPKSKKALFEEIEIETDEDAGFQLSWIHHHSSFFSQLNKEESSHPQ
ncbi:dgkA [Lepeophtheirus salmonis]|uniref:Diacylglycerol kinase n=1 Tax=Lepeophtheirus salmonis TaxID=72036 RepID=A0A7R8D045_LEPSM|nr:dgkA [Lepeophtheirus salmonis]CAF2981094.1 dgkA [Lepeophtheirus salmonis]